MPHWIAGRVIVPRENMDSHFRRFFTDVETIWVIAHHNWYIYFNIKRTNGTETIARCPQRDMPKYFREVIFHEKMPYISGKLNDIRVFPDDFISSVPGAA